MVIRPPIWRREAMDWADRSVANGTTAITTRQMAAASMLAQHIHAAGIRDRFIRLSCLFGTGLSAMLVPFFRSQSLGGTTYGNTTDANVSFVSADYTETSGLTGNTTTKHLNTGVNANVLTSSDRHLSAVFTPSSSTAGIIGLDNFGAGGNVYWGIYALGTTNVSFRNGTTSGFTTNTVTAGRRHVVVSGNGTAQSYIDGSAGASSSNTAFTAPAQPIFVSAINRNGGAVDRAATPIGAYSIGLAMTAAQALSYSQAMSRFLSAIGRT